MCAVAPPHCESNVDESRDHIAALACVARPGPHAHVVTADLDEGSIIEQDIGRAGHAHTAEDRILLLDDDTVVFP